MNNIETLEQALVDLGVDVNNQSLPHLLKIRSFITEYKTQVHVDRERLENTRAPYFSFDREIDKLAKNGYNQAIDDILAMEAKNAGQ
jgi:hypothetical protein